MTEGVAKQSLSLYGCIGSTLVAWLLQGRMEEGIMLTSLDAEGMKKINSMWKYRWCQFILQYSPWTDAFVDLVVSPRQFTNFRSVSLGRGFVSTSAMLSDVGVYRKMTSPDLVCSLMKWYRISMCFVHQWFLSVVLFAMEPLLSAQMMIGLVKDEIRRNRIEG